MKNNMKRILFWLLAVSTLALTSCSENYSNGERIGFITKFSNRGIMFKSWEGEMNITQTGMNTSSTFQFSIDNDREDQNIIKTLDSAVNLGWKTKIVYHETVGKNWFGNRGQTDHFIKDVIILDKNPMNIFGGNSQAPVTGKVIDTIYVVIVPKAPTLSHTNQ